MTLANALQEIDTVVTRRHIVAAVSAVLIVVVGFFAARRVSAALGRISRFDLQQRLLFQKLSYYLIATLTVACALNELGFDLKVLLGAAGVLTVAAGFAAQTSASNLISGLFLMADRPFVIGQAIKVGDVVGEVVSVDLLSCRIRTYDNLMIRIPNETMIKTNIVNFSYFPIRRIDLNMGIGYGSSIPNARAALLRACDRSPLVLDEPKPLFVFQGFGESCLTIQFQAWALSENLGSAQNALFEAAKEELEASGVEIAYPRRVLQL